MGNLIGIHKHHEFIRSGGGKPDGAHAQMEVNHRKAIRESYRVLGGIDFFFSQPTIIETVHG